MAKLAVVDVGSNAIRLLCVGIDSCGRTDLEEFHRYPLRLGTDVFEHGYLLDSTVEKLREVFATISTRMEDLEIDGYRAVATSAMREAANAQDVLRDLKHSTGLDLEVIDGLEESRLSRVGLSRAVGFLADDTVLIDLGGGSLELERADGDQAQSLPFGTVRLLTQYPELNSKVSPERLASIQASIDTDLAGAIRNWPPPESGSAVGTGGNLNALSRLLPIGGGYLDAIEVTGLGPLAEEVATLELDQRGDAYSLRPDRADLILPALLVVRSLVERFKLGTIVVPGSGIRDAMLFEMASRDTACGDPLAQLQKAGVADEETATRLEFAGRIFAALAPLHKLWPAALSPWQVAICAHAWGQHINAKEPVPHARDWVHQNAGLSRSPDGRLVADYILLAAATDERRHQVHKKLPQAFRDVADLLAALHPLVANSVASSVSGHPVRLHLLPDRTHLEGPWPDSGIDSTQETLGQLLGVTIHLR